MPDAVVGEGSEKIFFATEKSNIVLGLYKDNTIESKEEKIKRLNLIVGAFNPTRDPAYGEDDWNRYFCWPTDVIHDPSIGIVTPKFPENYYFKEIKGEKKGKWFTSPNLQHRLEAEEKGDIVQRLKVCRHLSKAIGRMHSAGLAHTDLSGNNILMDLTIGECILIDIDSLAVRGMFPPKVLGTRGYIAPELVKTADLPIDHPEKALPNIKTDLHSLSVIIYQLLLLRHPLEGKKINADDPDIDECLMYGDNALFIENPYDTSNRVESITVRYSSLGPYLAGLMERSFIEGLKIPDARPTAFEWEEAIDKTLEILYPCKNRQCWAKWFVCALDSTAQCPFCGCKPSEVIPLMFLFRNQSLGKFIKENYYVTIWNRKRLLFKHWRSKSEKLDKNNMERKLTSVYFRRNGSTWYLKNTGNTKMVASTSGIIMPGNEHEITHNGYLLLNRGAFGRLAVFKILNEKN